MIQPQQMIPLLLDACPSFQPAWEEYRRELGEDLLYPAIEEFARQLLRQQQTAQTEGFPAVAQVIERLILEGEQQVREIAVIGVLEAIQNVWGNNNTDPELFAEYLLTESKHWWQSLNDFWSGKVRFLGEGL